ncbi:hypothetical protein [Oscillatoria sp. HE19RPO]|uniref:hypothetical protein n=1 Tax=Oscillatoria sp. HE19RPO TaxID=2954806 RepID=UPI0020C2156E|nr:hypothetical protein [Oscillatoria sp. HE19RPO]
MNKFSAQNTNKLYVVLTSLVPLLLVYLPKTPISGSQFIIYPLLALLFSSIIFWISIKKKLFIVFKVKFLIVLFLLYDLILVISFLINTNELRSTAPLELFRPLLLVIFLLYGYSIARLGNKNSLEEGLLIAAYTIILGQFILGVFQALGLNYFSVLYSAEKSREFGLIFRVTGSLGNPNNMAWVVSNSAMIVSFLGHKNKKLYWLFLMIAFIVVVMSSSRTIILLFPLMIISSIFLASKSNYKNLRALIIIGLFISISIFLIFVLGSQYFPYLSQLKLVVKSGNLMSINSFSLRVIHWENVYQEFSSAGLLREFFGLGSRQIVRTVDNDFLYILYRVGWVGLSIHLFISLYSFIIFQKSKVKNIAAIGRHYLFFALVFGLVAETLASWYQPLLLFFILGLNIGCSEKSKKILKFSNLHSQIQPSQIYFKNIS